MSKQVTPIVHGTRYGYCIGFVTSLVLTITAYLVVTQDLLSGDGLLLGIMGLAVLQFMVQVIFFLHIGKEKKPRWNLAVFGFMIVILLIIVGGSLWIMKSLDYNMMQPSPEQQENYMERQSGF